MISYKDAVEIFTSQERSKWEHPGEFYVDPKGFENEEFYLLPYGAKEYLEEASIEFEIADLPAALVNKETGAILFVTVLDNLDFIETFRAI